MTTAVFSAPLRRFAWKEYRTLRGLWLAVLVLGLLVDWVAGMALLVPSMDFAVFRLCVALGAATVYAAGAAAVLFSMEHEENTYDFLRGLPATWWPLFAGKLLVATGSAMTLATVLAIVGLSAGGEFRAVTERDMALALGIFGVAIFEAIAWGTLWSLVLKRPLAAAVMTFFVGGLVVNLAVTAVGADGMLGTDPRAFVTAIPLRLLIILVVLGICVAIARNWLTPASRGANATVPLLFSRALPTLVASASGLRTHVARYRFRSRRRSMMLRLVWQGWRESWKYLLLPVLVAAACIGISIVCSWMWPTSRVPSMGVAIATIFFGPAMFGALAFSADQRRGYVKFLAEHAARPRYVWLSRHVIWGGALTLLALLLMLTVATWVFSALQINLERRFQQIGSYSERFSTGVEFRNGLHTTATITALAWWGVFSAYAIGQMCSMVLRSEILASFLSFALAMVLSAFVCALFVWDLGAWMFLMPLAAGFLWATWLRAPDWIAGRNDWRAWWKPGLMVGGTLVAVGVLLPAERLNQISYARAMMGWTEHASDSSAAGALPKQAQKEAEATAEMYLKAAAMLDDNPIEPWQQLYSADTMDRWGVDEKRIPATAKPAFEAAKKKAQANYAAAFKLAIEASKRPSCRFAFDLNAVDPTPMQRSRREFASPQDRFGPNYRAAEGLLTTLLNFTTEGLSRGKSVPLEQLLAALRLSAHIRSGQPTAIWQLQLDTEQMILQWIGAWAFKKGTTNEERRDALAQLQAYFRSIDLAEPFLGDRRVIRDVVLGKTMPMVLNGKTETDARAAYLAYIANELPWERVRALEALDVITDQNVKTAIDLTNYLMRTTTLDNGHETLRVWLRPYDEQPAWVIEQPAAVTSYLMSMEYRARVDMNMLLQSYCNTKTWQNAVQIKIALAMYWEDNGEFPVTLAELVPKYLKREPLDPFAMQPFGYFPQGLDVGLHPDGNPGSPAIIAGTPFFWSVGPGNRQLQKMVGAPRARDTIDAADSASSEVPAGPEGGPGGEGNDAYNNGPGQAPIYGSYYYFLYGAGATWSSHNPLGLIFELPLSREARKRE